MSIIANWFRIKIGSVIASGLIPPMLAVLYLPCATAFGGAIFVTGHDPDFHASLGGNSAGAQDINRVAISYVLDPAYNHYAAIGLTKFLFVESSITPPSGYTDGVNGIIASGYTQGVNFDRRDASTLNAAISQLGTTYGALVVASDFGGILTQAELDILNSRAPDIAQFVNHGGGLYAMAEGDNGGTGLTPRGGWFNFVPIVTSAADLNQNESGYTVTPFGASLGLSVNDVNGNASHNIFTNIGSLNVVDMDASGHILSAAAVTTIPEPATAAALSLASFIALSRRKR